VELRVARARGGYFSAPVFVTAPKKLLRAVKVFAAAKRAASPAQAVKSQSI
jgi:hypothetical protein